MRQVVIIILFLIGGYFFIKRENERGNEIFERGLEEPGLLFSGIITGIEEVNGYNGYGIITIEILNSNVNEYDPRDTVDYYYCIIKGKIAELYDHTTGILIGDTLNVDTKKRLISTGKKGNEHDEGSIRINSSANYYKYIKQHTGFVRN